jgi:hypothetical protein
MRVQALPGPGLFQCAPSCRLFSDVTCAPLARHSPSGLRFFQRGQMAFHLISYLPISWMLET